MNLEPPEFSAICQELMEVRILDCSLGWCVALKLDGSEILWTNLSCCLDRGSLPLVRKWTMPRAAVFHTNVWSDCYGLSQLLKGIVQLCLSSAPELLLGQLLFLSTNPLQFALSSRKTLRAAAQLIVVGSAWLAWKSEACCWTRPRSFLEWNGALWASLAVESSRELCRVLLTNHLLFLSSEQLSSGRLWPQVRPLQVQWQVDTANLTKNRKKNQEKKNITCYGTVLLLFAASLWRIVRCGRTAAMDAN